jgi:hypothetical protein
MDGSYYGQDQNRSATCRSLHLALFSLVVLMAASFVMAKCPETQAAAQNPFSD